MLLVLLQHTNQKEPSLVILAARIDQDMTQSELAARIGTHQSNISRLESGNYNPSLEFLKKVARGLGKELHISFK